MPLRTARRNSPNGSLFARDGEVSFIRYSVTVKAYANEGKHGVTFDEVSTVFGDVLSVCGRDLEHSVEENRFVTFGLSSQGRVLVVSHTDRGGVIRIISACPAIRKEKRIYEEG